jgi:hypothetical protein
MAHHTKIGLILLCIAVQHHMPYGTNSLHICRTVGKHDRIQLRTLLNKNNSVIECIFNIGASFYTTREQRKWHKHEQRRSETSCNQTYLMHIQSR